MIKEVRDKIEWMQVLNSIRTYDCYHTFDYHHVSVKKDDTPVLLVYSFRELLIALPLIIRPIFETNYYDATSVYGYSGPIVSNAVDTDNIIDFQNELNKYFKEKNIISVFARLNPFINNQEIILSNLGSINNLGKIVNIDLTKDIDVQRQLFSKTTKRYLNKARKICSTFKSKEKKDILTFIDLYYENMDRVNAEKSYYFDKKYFFEMIDSEDFFTEVIFAFLRETNEIISAAMVMKTDKIVQYHISGTRNDYLGITPIRLLLDEVRIDSTNDGYTCFNLGGGLGSEEDSLFNFKASFSKDFKQFKVWNYIVNKNVYAKLSADIKVETDFFPLYRYTKNQ